MTPELIDQYARDMAIGFFKWNCQQASEYLDYLRRYDSAQGISQKHLEIDRFERGTLLERYNLYLEYLKTIK